MLFRTGRCVSWDERSGSCGPVQNAEAILGVIGAGSVKAPFNAVAAHEKLENPRTGEPRQQRQIDTIDLGEQREGAPLPVDRPLSTGRHEGAAS